jgi:hypothetical protein
MQRIAAASALIASKLEGVTLRPSQCRPCDEGGAPLRDLDGTELHTTGDMMVAELWVLRHLGYRVSDPTPLDFLDLLASCAPEAGRARGRMCDLLMESLCDRFLVEASASELADAILSCCFGYDERLARSISPGSPRPRTTWMRGRLRDIDRRLARAAREEEPRGPAPPMVEEEPRGPAPPMVDEDPRGLAHLMCDEDPRGLAHPMGDEEPRGLAHPMREDEKACGTMLEELLRDGGYSVPWDLIGGGAEMGTRVPGGAYACAIVL